MKKNKIACKEKRSEGMKAQAEGSRIKVLYQRQTCGTQRGERHGGEKRKNDKKMETVESTLKW